MIAVQHAQAQGRVVSLNVGAWLNTVQQLLNNKKKKNEKSPGENRPLVMEIGT